MYVHVHCVLTISLLRVHSRSLFNCIYFVHTQAVAAMVEECCKFVDQTPDMETKLKLIDTLRTVSEGKVRLCIL